MDTHSQCWLLIPVKCSEPYNIPSPRHHIHTVDNNQHYLQIFHIVYIWATEWSREAQLGYSSGIIDYMTYSYTAGSTAALPSPSSQVGACL